MSKQKDQEIVKPAQELPAYLRGKNVRGMETARDYILLQRVKVMQKSSGNDLLKNFPMGTVITTPALTEIAPMKLDGNKPGTQSAPFTFIPLFFFAAWGRLNPMELKGKEPLFFDYTIDPNSDIAKKAKNKMTREETHPRFPTMKIKNIEMLNFVVSIEDERFEDTPVILSFAKGEWMSGSQFLTRIKQTRASIFARRWQGVSNIRSRNNNEWFGIDVAEPSDNKLWVSEDQYANLEKIHEQLMADHEKSGLQPQGLDEDDQGGGDPDNPAEKPKY